MAENSTYRLVVDAAETYLRVHNFVEATKAAKSKQVVDHILKMMKSGELDIDITPGTVLNYISIAANKDVDSSITSGGSWGGYWIAPINKSDTNKKPTDTAKIQSKQGKQFTLSERDLYPLIEVWLASKGYVSKDVSSLKSGGKWGNPDIVGITRVELFGSVDIEIASCEVKLSDANWEQFIFEAISHKRSSNRSWFCYRISEDINVMPKGIEYYAERYRVGIVQVFLTDNEMINLKSKKTEPIDLVERVREKVPAIYDFVPLQEKRDLIDRANIKITVAF